MFKPTKIVNLYKELRIKDFASDDDIRKAYRNLAKKYHPDKKMNSGDKEYAAERFMKIKEALDVLTDREKKKQHDETLKLKAMETKMSSKRASNKKAMADLYASADRIAEEVRRGKHGHHGHVKSKRPAGRLITKQEARELARKNKKKNIQREPKSNTAFLGSNQNRRMRYEEAQVKDAQYADIMNIKKKRKRAWDDYIERLKTDPDAPLPPEYANDITPEYKVHKLIKFGERSVRPKLEKPKPLTAEQKKQRKEGELSMAERKAKRKNAWARMKMNKAKSSSPLALKAGKSTLKATSAAKNTPSPLRLTASNASSPLRNRRNSFNKRRF